MARLGIDKSFLDDFVKLQKPVRDRVSEVFGKFGQATHAGLHLEKVANPKDDRFRTIRIDQFWRGVVYAPESGDNYVLLTVLPHDDAYQWAQRRRASVNTAVGTIEICDVDTLEAAITVQGYTDSAGEAAALLDGVGDADLRRLGIDDAVLSFARTVTVHDQLEAAKAFLPEKQWEVLYGLSAGLSPEDVWTEIGAYAVTESIDPDDIAAAVERSRDRVVLVDGSEEFLEILRHPFDKWRIYLHPLQRRVVETSYRGPARVAGGPGTGKTVAVLHRANHLAQQGRGRVLVTTFTSTLASSLRSGLRLLTDSAEVHDAVDIRNVDQLSHQTFTARHGRPALFSPDDERRMWSEITARLEVPFSEAFLGEEWRRVVLAHQVRSAAEYLKTKRVGRGRALGSRQRSQVWQAIWEFQDQLRDRGLWTHETVCVEAARLLAETIAKPYKHVLVDEGQDLSAMQWRMLRALTAPGPDDMFIAGDTHQRIYANRVSLRDLGINVGGRSTRLSINYRTTAEILQWSTRMLHGEQFDDMDGGIDSILGCRSETHGLPPDVVGYPSRDVELEALVARVRDWIATGVDPAEIGVAGRAGYLAEAAAQALESAGIPARIMKRNGSVDGAVSVGTMHRTKGLEFRCLAVIGAGSGMLPAGAAVTPSDEDEQAHRQDMQRERCLLFVACTRARELLSVTWHGDPSPFLSDVIERS